MVPCLSLPVLRARHSPPGRHATRLADPIKKLRERLLPELFSDNRGVGAPARDFTVPRLWERRRKAPRVSSPRSAGYLFSPARRR